jgi:hypothetical protein
MRLAIGLGLALLASTGARAQDAPICTDRPAKGNAVCTVPAGTWQVETSMADWLRLEQGGSESETLLLGATVVKLGLTAASDLQVGLTPFVRTSADGNHLSGFGDVTVRYKQRLTGAESAVQVAVIPFVKLPTAKRGIGNGKAEGGVALPVSFALVGPVTATLGPEIDLLADAGGNGRHPAIAQLINLSAPVAPRLALAAELWANWNFDPAGTVRQVSADIAAAYAASTSVQLDAGVNAGLTRDTPDVELYAGFSVRL